MLKNWAVTNFKPIVESGNLELSEVTVLAGLNSSGKSSLLQTILMISQTLSSRVLDRALLPSGPSVRLGTYEDILNTKSESPAFEVGFKLTLESNGKQLPRRRTASRLIVKSIAVSATFNNTSVNGAILSAIESSHVVEVQKVVYLIEAEYFSSSPLTITDIDQFHAEATPVRIQFEVVKADRENLRRFLTDVVQELNQYREANEMRQAQYLGKFKILEGKIGGEKLPGELLVSLSHFLPARLLRKYDVIDRLKQSSQVEIRYLFDVTSHARPAYPSANMSIPSFPGLLEMPMSEEVKTEIAEIVATNREQNEFTGNNLQELLQWFAQLKLNARRGIQSPLLLAVSKFIDQVEIQISTPGGNKAAALETLENNIFGDIVEQATEQVTRFFSSKIRYLGPLRDNPQNDQKFAPSGEPDDVGAEGQHAAAVYDANQRAPVRWLNPNDNTVISSSFQDALDCWVQYLGVAHQVRTQIVGQSGISWRIVHREGDSPMPLSAVGVGVSQILPILVMGLLSPLQTLLIVEQPELHLHPSVQSKLGDFFVGLARCGKQCLIETHSENLVGQLRYHIVQAAEEQIRENSQIYFVCQDNKGATLFEPIEISARGNILNWPPGFFDETLLQEDKIASLSIIKRTKES